MGEQESPLNWRETFTELYEEPVREYLRNAIPENPGLAIRGSPR